MNRYLLSGYIYSKMMKLVINEIRLHEIENVV